VSLTLCLGRGRKLAASGCIGGKSGRRQIDRNEMERTERIDVRTTNLNTPGAPPFARAARRRRGVVRDGKKEENVGTTRRRRLC